MRRTRVLIWYATNRDRLTSFSSAHLKKASDVVPGTTHQPVAVIEVEGDEWRLMAEDAFEKMQGENWSPNGEARPLITALGLRHTSMSVGDVVDFGDMKAVVDPFGFRVLPV